MIISKTTQTMVAASLQHRCNIVALSLQNPRTANIISKATQAMVTATLLFRYIFVTIIRPSSHPARPSLAPHNPATIQRSIFRMTNPPSTSTSFLGLSPLRLTPRVTAEPSGETAEGRPRLVGRVPIWWFAPGCFSVVAGLEVSGSSHSFRGR